MPQESFIPIPALAPGLDHVEAVSRVRGDSLRQLRSKLEEADQEAENLVSDYRDAKEGCDKANFEMSICGDHLAKCYATGDLVGALALEKKQEGLLHKQAEARDNMMSALWVLGEMARKHQKYRQVIVDLDQAATDFTKAIQSCFTITNGDSQEPRGV